MSVAPRSTDSGRSVFGRYRRNLGADRAHKRLFHRILLRKALGSRVGIKAMARVWEHSKQKGTALLVELAIADYADDFGCAWPSVSSLARKSRVTDRTVQNILHQLEEAGELKIERGAGLVKTPGGPQRTHRYRLVVGDLGGENLTPPSRTRGDVRTTQGGAIPSKGGEVAVSPEPSVNPSIKPSLNAHQLSSLNANGKKLEDLAPEEAARVKTWVRSVVRASDDQHRNRMKADAVRELCFSLHLAPDVVRALLAEAVLHTSAEAVAPVAGGVT